MTTHEMPPSLRTRPRDPRGYPVPFVVLVDKTGRPHFTINNHLLVNKAIRKKLCAMCGKRLDDGLWFIGGPLSFLHADGAFLDPPSHEACGRYALRVCPYLAAPRYGGRIDARTLKPGALPNHAVLLDPTIIPERPVLFMLGRVERMRVGPPGATLSSPYLHREGEWTALEYWQHGQRLDDAEGEAIAQRALAEHGP